VIGAATGAVGHIFLLYFLWRILGRGHGILGIVLVGLVVLLFFGWRYYRNR
jgi:hypothetical protein